MKIRLLIIIMVFTKNICFSQTICFSLDSLVKQTINSISKKDVNIYISMWNKEKFIEAIKADSTNRKSEFLIKNIETITAAHKKNFDNLIKQLKSQLFTDVFQITLINYEFENLHSDSKNVKEYGLEILFVINGVTRKIYTPVAEYNGCFYFFEPISDVIQTN